MLCTILSFLSNGYYVIIAVDGNLSNDQLHNYCKYFKNVQLSTITIFFFFLQSENLVFCNNIEFVVIDTTSQ